MQKRPRASKLRRGQAAFNSLYAKYRHSARRRGVSFDLTKKEFRKLTRGCCYLCGDPPSQTAWATNKQCGSYHYNGIDRIDNTEGYEMWNCKPCCMRCNQLKSSLTVEELKSHISKILNHGE